jgi:glycosyltransferase involved in cell wall biosynthesis
VEDKQNDVPEDSVSVVVPTKNERGHVSDIINSVPEMGSWTEIVFVDGDSTDGTRETIRDERSRYSGNVEIRLVEQGDGTGKADALRKGFAEARGRILMILDGDVTVPPRGLRAFFQVLDQDRDRFVNGTRMVEPMENGAMRPLNYLGNRFFAYGLSAILGVELTDTLFGTKALSREHYESIKANQRWEEMDPFGDFQLLFGAVRLGLTIVEVPVSYRRRRYGETEINRFSDGFSLVKMTACALWEFRIKSWFTGKDRFWT